MGLVARRCFFDEYIQQKCRMACADCSAPFLFGYWKVFYNQSWKTIVVLFESGRCTVIVVDVERQCASQGGYAVLQLLKELAV